MGIYLDPGNSGFQRIVNSEYVDKTELLSFINDVIDTVDNLVCVSRPRRFGKSFAAKMICAYYDCFCDSHGLFDDKKIARTEEYLVHLNQYHVINLDITTFLSVALRKGISLTEVPDMIVDTLQAELEELYPECAKGRELMSGLVRCAEITGKKFIFVIDEWDALFREAKNDVIAQKRYLNLLREWFKSNNFTSKFIAAAYMTGILPIKKDGSQSAISDFKEYTILDPGKFAEFTGFTEEEVYSLCEKHHMDYPEVKQWYDGYDFPKVRGAYNPYSVMCAMRNQKFGSYWQKTSAAESLMTYINMDFEGLQETIACLIAGEAVEVKTDRFENDFETFKSKDDVLTLLIHLGYLTWREEEKIARIPNEEVRSEFEKILEGTGVNAKWIELIARSRKLIEDTIAGNSAEVAKAIEAHTSGDGC